MDNPIDISFEDINKNYYTIDQVSKILDLDQSNIIFYFEKLNDFLDIKSIGMYQLFDDMDIKNLEIIKNLDINKNMSIKQIKEYLKNNRQEIILQKEENNKLAMSPIDIFSTFVNILNEQNTKINLIYEENKQLVNKINDLNKNQEYIIQQLEEQEKINEQLLSRDEREIAITKKMSEIDDNLRNLMNSTKREFEESNQKEKSHLWNKLFKR